MIEVFNPASRFISGSQYGCLAGPDRMDLTFLGYGELSRVVRKGLAYLFLPRDSKYSFEPMVFPVFQHKRRLFPALVRAYVNRP